MIRRPRRSTLFPTGGSSDLGSSSWHRARSGARPCRGGAAVPAGAATDRKSTRLNSSHGDLSYAVFRLKQKNTHRCYSGPTPLPLAKNRNPATRTAPVRHPARPPSKLLITIFFFNERIPPSFFTFPHKAFSAY